GQRAVQSPVSLAVVLSRRINSGPGNDIMSVYALQKLIRDANRKPAGWVAVLVAATVYAAPCHGQSSTVSDPDEARIEDISTASRILANEGILDSFGHISARSAKRPDRFFMPRAMPPALVSRADIVEVGLDCKPVAPDAPRLNGERYIHCEIYKARSD